MIINSTNHKLDRAVSGKSFKKIISTPKSSILPGTRCGGVMVDINRQTDVNRHNTNICMTGNI